MLINIVIIEECYRAKGSILTFIQYIYCKFGSRVFWHNLKIIQFDPLYELQSFSSVPTNDNIRQSLDILSPTGSSREVSFETSDCSVTHSILVSPFSFCKAFNSLSSLLTSDSHNWMVYAI